MLAPIHPQGMRSKKTRLAVGASKPALEQVRRWWLNYKRQLKKPTRKNNIQFA